MAPIRFAKKLPVPEAAELSVATCLVAFFRARGDGQSHANVAVSRLVRHLVHVFCQHVETQIARRLLSHCPDPSHEARLHPFLGHARRRGSKALELSLIQRFTAKGGGFVSTAGELSLQRLGVVKQGSSLAQRTGSEYVARSLIHTAEFVSDYVSRASPVVLNFAMDATHVGGEHVPCLILTRVFSHKLDGFLNFTSHMYTADANNPQQRTSTSYS